MDLNKLYSSLHHISERYLHRCKFFIIFLNLIFYGALLISIIAFYLRKYYRKWTTFGGLSD